METQSGARTPLVDPFGRELEEWLRDAPATRVPYVADLVVPPVTGPVLRPAAATIAASKPAAEPPVTESATVDAPVVDASAFRRRDRARHAAACAPSFPEPPERLALRIEDLAVEVSSTSGRTTIERIDFLEDEVRRRDEDLARLAAWEAVVAAEDSAELIAAREYARTVFADLLADAAEEADRQERSAARRAATAPVALAMPAPVATIAPATVTEADVPDATDAPDVTAPEPDAPARPVLRLPAVPVSANTRPTPLVQPVTGPTAFDRQAFTAALTAHAGSTAATPVVFPVEHASELPSVEVVETESPTDADAEPQPAGWWARIVDRVLRLLGRR